MNHGERHKLTKAEVRERRKKPKMRMHGKGTKRLAVHLAERSRHR